jgi:ATP-dependent protease HslVU (ClpYQ) peptidase subunit
VTCIVGLVDAKTVWMGADSHASAGCQSYRLDDLERKVFRRGDMLIGVTGASRATQVFKYILEIPEHPSDVEPFTYLVTALAPSIRRAIHEHDGLKINDPSDGWEILLGYRGGLYSICHDLSATVLPVYGAVGCGREIALGSLHTTGVMTQEEHWKPEERLLAALEAAVEHDIHVAPPFVLESIE